MKKKYVLFSDDTYLIAKLTPVFPPKEMAIKQTKDFPSVEESPQLILIDGDALPLKSCQKALKKFKREKIPVVYLFKTLTGQETMDILKQGVISVLFKEYSPQRMKKELKEILYNFNFLEEVKELAENDAKTQKFLGVVKTLSSDNDINSIMISILNSMKEVFQLETTIFFVAARNKLRQKIILGKEGKKLPKGEWDLDDQGTGWLKDIREKKKPIYITAKSGKSYKKYFKENTLLLPLVIKEKFLGLIAATFRSASRKLSKSEITLLTAFAEQTALALENAQLYWDVIKAREELVNQEKKTLLGQIALSLNHEINNPLSIISMEAQLLQKRMTKKEAKVEARLANIENNIERIKVILEAISSLDIDGQITEEEYIKGRQMLNLFNGH